MYNKGRKQEHSTLTTRGQPKPDKRDSGKSGRMKEAGERDEESGETGERTLGRSKRWGNLPSAGRAGTDETVRQSKEETTMKKFEIGSIYKESVGSKEGDKRYRVLSRTDKSVVFEELDQDGNVLDKIKKNITLLHEVDEYIILQKGKKPIYRQHANGGRTRYQVNFRPGQTRDEIAIDPARKIEPQIVVAVEAVQPVEPVKTVEANETIRKLGREEPAERGTTMKTYRIGHAMGYVNEINAFIKNLEAHVKAMGYEATVKDDTITTNMSHIELGTSRKLISNKYNDFYVFN